MKLLLVRLSAIGDVVHTLPALEVLRAAAPGAQLTWVVEAQAAPLLRDHPALDRVVVLDRRAALRAGTRLQGVRGLRRGLASLRSEPFDAAIDLQGLLRSAVVARLSGAARILGPAWAREGARFLYTHGLRVPRPDEAHAVDRAVALARATLALLGQPAPSGEVPPPRLPRLPDANADPVTAPGEPQRSAAGRREVPACKEPVAPGGLAGWTPKLVLLPGAGKPANRPTPSLLAGVADRCARVYPGMEISLVGGPGDAPLAAAVQRRCLAARPASVCHQGLLDTAATLATASVVLGGDTGPLHLARALDRPVVALFHAADPARTGPAKIPGTAPVRVLSGQAPCAPCRARRCERRDRVRLCLETNPERVAAEVLGLLELTAPVTL